MIKALYINGILIGTFCSDEAKLIAVLEKAGYQVLVRDLRNRKCCKNATITP